MGVVAPWRGKFTAPIGIPLGTGVGTLGGGPFDPADNVNLVLGLGIPSGVTIDGAHNDSVTTINVSDGSLFRPGMEFTAETTETFKVISISSNALTVDTRGYDSTTAAVLAGGEAVTITAYEAGQTGPYGATFFTGGLHSGDGVLDITGVSWGCLTVPAAWTAADISFFGSSSRTGTFVPIVDKDNTLLVISSITTNASRQYFIPSQVFAGGPYLKIKSITAAGGDPTSLVTQADDRVVIFTGGE